MSLTLFIFLIISLAGTLAIIIGLFIKHKNIRQFIICLVLWTAGCIVLWLLFFPGLAVIPKGSSSNDIYFVLILYACMFLGMLAEQGYAHFSLPRQERQKQKKRGSIAWLLPVFASPIIFIPLLAALQNVEIDLMKLTVPRLMIFFVAFENGFFWKGYLEKRRDEFRGGETERGNTKN